MSDTKISPEWCEVQAADIDGFALDPSTSRDDSERAKLISEALRLAARALEAREQILCALVDGFDTREATELGDGVLAILDGRTP